MDLSDKDTLALVAHRVPVVMHHHHAIQLVVSLDQPYPAVLDGYSIDGVTGFLIDAQVPHACAADSSTVLVVSVDAEARKGRALRHLLAGRRYMALEELVPNDVYDRFRAGYWQQAPESEVGPFDPLALVAHLSAPPLMHARDPRVSDAMEVVARRIEHMLSLSEVARAVGLSERRLRHLFVRDTGISLRSYVLWSRMKIALHALVARGATLTEAALDAGFADHAHFTRTFRQMFGVSPSVLLKHSHVISVFGLP